MKLSADQWQQLSAWFDEAAALPADLRDAVLARAQAASPELAERLQRMLAELPFDDATLIAPVDAAPAFQAQLAQALAQDAEAPPVAAGDRFGAWRLVRLLGEGGMGEVWLAERADGLYEGQAAVKLLRGDLAGPGLAARFARERALLGRLSHPGIARLLDAGEQQGRAFLVLEHVVGTTLSEHVRAQALGLNARVRLLLAVARAVEHAHAQLIVHRDLKPSNVMVHESGTTKLLDFGIAGLLDDSGAQTDHQLTQLAGRRLTPAYAAPEQIRGGAIGIAADVYSLGVMLYELASGHLPFGSASSSRTALEHAVLHTQAPRITRSATGAEADPPQNGPGRPPDAARARGDLEAVAAKAMRKEPGERYASVGALILDLQRWLDQRPVSVRAEDWRHRTHLWMRRNAALVTGGVLVLATLSVGLGVSLWQRNQAQAAARQSEAVTDYLTEVLSAASPDENGGKQPTVLELLDAKRQELASRFTDQPEVKTRIYATLTDSYFAQQRFGVAAEMAQARLALARQAFGPDDPRTDDAAKSLASVHTSVAGVLPVVELLEPLLPRTDARHGPLSEEATSMRMNLLVAYARLGRFADAYRLLADLQRAFAALYPPGSMNASKLTSYQSIVYTTEGRLKDAVALLESTRPLWKATRPEDMRPALVLERNHAFTYWRLATESMAEATARSEDLIRRWDALARSGNHGSTLMRQQLAWYLQQMGQFAAAAHELDLAQQLTESAGAEDAITGLLRRIARLEGQVLAQGAATAADVAAAAELHRRLNESPLIGDVRRAEGLLALGRTAMAPGAGAAGRQLAEAIVAEHDQLQREFTQARNLRSRLGLLKARVAGTDEAWLAATAERVGYFKSLSEPQGLVGWIAHMQRACALRAAGHDWQAALDDAQRVQPPRLLALTPTPHPLLSAVSRLQAGDPSLPRDCDWRF